MIETDRFSRTAPGPLPRRAEPASDRSVSRTVADDRFREALKRSGQDLTESQEPIGAAAMIAFPISADPTPFPARQHAISEAVEAPALPLPVATQIADAPPPPCPSSSVSAEAAFAAADRFERAVDAASRSSETQLSLPSGWAAREVTLAVAADGNASMSLDMEMDDRGRHAEPAELSARLERVGIRLVETEILVRRMRSAEVSD